VVGQVVDLPDLTDTTSCNPSNLSLSTFISKVPIPPTANDYGYWVNPAGIDYILQAKMETASGGLLDDIDEGKTIDTITLNGRPVFCQNTTANPPQYFYCLLPI
jgi:hypothetical protein